MRLTTLPPRAVLFALLVFQAKADLTITNGDFEGSQFFATDETGNSPRDFIHRGLYATHGDGWFTSNNPQNWDRIAGGPSGSGSYGAKDSSTNNRGIVNIITDNRASTGAVTLAAKALYRSNGGSENLVVKVWGVREGTPGQWDGWIDLTGPSGNNDGLDIRNYNNSLAPSDPAQTSSTSTAAYVGTDFTPLFSANAATLGLSPSDAWQDLSFNVDLGATGYDQVIVGFSYFNSSGTPSGVDNLTATPAAPLPVPILTATPSALGPSDTQVSLSWTIGNFPAGSTVSIECNRVGIGPFDVTAQTSAGGSSTAPLVIPYASGSGNLGFTLEVTEPGAGFRYSDELTVTGPGDQLPNVLLVMVDDMGWSDISPYGGEIHTPTLQRLADEGLRYRDFHNEARCAPTRNALLTGLHVQTAATDPNRNLPPMRIDNNVTIAEMLRSIGYRTYVSGKWHLSEYQTQSLYTPLSAPTHRGFDYSFNASLWGGNLADHHSLGDYWDGPSFTLYPPNAEITPIAYDGTDPRASRVPFYKVDANVDYALAYLDHHQSKADGEPFFLYLAFNAPHFGLAAPIERINLYTDIADAAPGDDDVFQYEVGYEVVRQQRFQRQIAEGILPSGTRLPPFSPDPGGPGIPSWDSLTTTQKDDLSRRMAVYAAMVHGIDENLARVVARLEAAGELDNTIILFMSDNGGNAESGIFGNNFPQSGSGLSNLGLTDALELHVGGAWANVNNTPFRYFKHHTHEGGTRTPMIVRWPGGIPGSMAGSWTDERGHVIDIMPTLLDAVGLRYPQSFGGHVVEPVQGISHLPAWHGGKLPGRDLFIEHERNRAMYRGDWKLVTKTFSYAAIGELPGDEGELYNLREDPTEMNNLAFHKPEMLSQMVTGFNAWVDSQAGLNANRKLPAFSAESSAFVMPRGKELLVDQFNRANADDLDADQTSISGTLLGMGILPVGSVWHEGHNPSNATVNGKRLRLSGSVESGLQPSLDAAHALAAGGFAVELELAELQSVALTADDYLGLAVGLTAAEAQSGGDIGSPGSFRGNGAGNPGTADFVVEVGADLQMRVRVHGAVIATLPLSGVAGRLLATFENPDGFQPGSSVGATVYLDGKRMHESSFTWTKADASHLGLSANSSGYWEVDNLVVAPFPARDSLVARYAANAGLDPTLGGPDQDPDGDGVSTTIEWLLGTNPGLADNPLLGALGIGGDGMGGISLAYRRAAEFRAAGADCRVYSSEDLDRPFAGWEAVDVPSSITPDGSGYELIELMPPAPLPDALFFRLELTD